jgi:hypothetical protein
MIEVFLKQYGAFLFGLIFGLALKIQWFAQTYRGVQILIKIDGDKII